MFWAHKQQTEKLKTPQELQDELIVHRIQLVFRTIAAEIFRLAFIIFLFFLVMSFLAGFLG